MPKKNTTPKTPLTKGWLIPGLVAINGYIVIVLLLIWWITFRSSPEVEIPPEVAFPYETMEIEEEDRQVVANQVVVRLSNQLEEEDVRDFAASLGVVDVFHLGGQHWIFYFDTDANLIVKVGELKMLPQVEDADLDDIYELTFTPSDYVNTYSGFEQPYWWEAINARDAWEVVRHINERQVLVGLIDSQVDTGHPELSSNVSTLERDTGELHGTSVAGILAATSDNNDGIVSVGLDTIALRSARACYGSFCPASLLVWSMESLSAIGVRVLNMSFTSETDNSVIRSLVHSLDDSGVVLVAGAGNSGEDEYLYPAAYDEVLSVAALNPDLERANFSTFGTWVDFAMPGELIATTGVNGSYVNISGTSGASPIVAGIASLCLYTNPTLTAGQVKSILRESATALQDVRVKHGLIDSAKVVGACNANVLGASDINGEVLQAATGTGTSCAIPEWFCSGTDVLVPPVTCDSVRVHNDNSSVTKCSQCAEDYLFPRPLEWFCPTNQDEGQKDGTGRIGGDRNYYYFDYEQGTIMNVPPYGFGVGGLSL